MGGGLADRLKALKRETLAVIIAARDPRTPWAARLVAGLVVAYALSPIDLIPDFIPVLGHLDDLVLVPAERPSSNPWGGRDGSHAVAGGRGASGSADCQRIKIV